MKALPVIWINCHEDLPVIWIKYYEDLPVIWREQHQYHQTLQSGKSWEW